MLKIKWSTKNNFKNEFQSICVVKKSNIILMKIEQEKKYRNNNNV